MRYSNIDPDQERRPAVAPTAILFGDSDRHIIALLQLMTLTALYLAGRMLHLGPWYRAGLAAGACFFVYELWLIRNRGREDCFRAFLNNHYFGLSVFLGIACNYQFGR